MTLVDLFVVLVVLVVAQFVALPWGVAIFAVGALIVERLLRGERWP